MCTQCACLPSAASCDGCQRRFCYTCFNGHHDELARDLDDIVNCRNEIVETMRIHMPNDVTGQSACFEEINQWESGMYNQIDRVASKARELIRHHLSEARRNAQMELDRLSEELKEKQMTGGYMENDLNRMRQQLTKLAEKVQNCKNDIRIDTMTSNNIPWDSLITVKSTNNTSPAASSRRASNPYSRPTTVYNSAHDQSQSPPPPYRYANPSPVATPPYYYANPSPVGTPSMSRNNHRPSQSSTPIRRESRAITITCVCCKTPNLCYEGRQNDCSVCKRPIDL